jgi:hypothetical protein
MCDVGPLVNLEKKVHDSDMDTFLYSKYKVINKLMKQDVTDLYIKPLIY